MARRRGSPRVLVALVYLCLPVVKPVLKLTLRRNAAIWRRLQESRDRIVASPPPDAGLEASLPRRLYASLFYLLGRPTKRVLKWTVGRSPGAWHRVRAAHSWLLYGASGRTGADAAAGVADGAEMRSFGVNIAGYFDSPTGTGETARAAARLLQAVGIPIALNNVIGPSSGELAVDSGELSADNPYAINLMYVNPDQAANFAWDKGEAYFRGHYNIGVWAWELTDFPEDWLPRFRYFDEIWVSSDFIRESLSRVSPVPVFKMPFAINPDPAISENAGLSDFGLSAGTFLYLFVFDNHSIFERKNPLGLIEAFKRAFGPEEPTALLVKSVHADDHALDRMLCAASGANVRIVNKVLTREEMSDLFNRCDCYVSLHRSEGFGLTLAEAMAAGKPVIATDYGGNTDFLTPESGYPVRYAVAEIQQDCGPYKKGQSWAEPDLDHAAQLMRLVFEKRAKSLETGRRGCEQILNLYRPEAVAELMKQRLMEIASGLGISVADSNTTETN